jgi:hypothetical protein
MKFKNKTLVHGISFFYFFTILFGGFFKTDRVRAVENSKRKIIIFDDNVLDSEYRDKVIKKWNFEAERFGFSQQCCCYANR